MSANVQDGHSPFAAGSSWTVSKLVGIVAATAAMPNAGVRFAERFLAHEAAGGSNLQSFAMAACDAGAEIVVVGGLAALAAYPFAPRLGRGLVLASEQVRAAAGRMRDFFFRSEVPHEDRRAVLSNDAVFSAALRRALEASGASYLALEAGEAMAVIGFADLLDSALEAILSGTEGLAGEMTATAICLKAHGMQAPTAMMASADGTAAALWALADGTPLATVGYDASGQPAWVCSHATGMVERSAEALEGAPSRAVAAGQMRAASERAARDYEELSGRMRMAANVGQATLREKDGTLYLRSRQDVLESSCGAPAVLRADGQATWLLNGCRISREQAEDLAYISGQPAVRA